jgi:hypothetical protein
MFNASGVTKWTFGNDLNGDGSQNFYLWDNVAFTSRILVDASGNVGIGTTSPGSPLQVNSSPVNTLVSDDVFGIYSKSRPSATSASSGWFTGIYGEVWPNTAQSYDTLVGARGEVNTNAGAGLTIANGMGVRGVAMTSNAGAVMTKAYGGYFGIINSAGSIGTGYGVYISNIAGTAKYSFYASDSSAPSYFAGKVGIGASSPSYPLDVVGDMNVSFWYRQGGQAILARQGGSTLLRGAAGEGISLGVNGANSAAAAAVTIDTSGSVGVGTTGPSYKLDVAGDTRIVGSSQTCIIGAGSGANCSSDVRLKEHITPIANALDKVLKLRGVEFDWNSKGRHPGRHDVGVIAQEVEQVFPSMVIESPDTGYKLVDYAALVSPLIQSTKELYGMCKATDELVSEHSREIASLNARLDYEKAAREQALAAKDQEIKELKARLDGLEKALRAITK